MRYTSQLYIAIHSTCCECSCSAAAIWSLADIAYIAIYRDMSKISRYCMAIFFKYIHRSNNHTIFMQVEVAMLEWRHKNKHIKCYRAREGGGGEETLYIGTYK